MLTIYFGNNSLALRAELLKKAGMHADIVPVRFDEVSIEISALEDTLGAAGLFGSTTVVVLDSVLEKSDTKERLLELLPDLHSSPNHYYLLAGDALAAERKLFEKSGATLVEGVSAKKGSGFNNASFALADAVGKKDRKSAWVLYRKAITHGAAPQEICGTLVWQMRLIVLAHMTENSGEAGVGDFPFKKAQSFRKYHTLSEAKKLLTRFLGIYHFDPDMNVRNTETALEKVLLTL